MSLGGSGNTIRTAESPSKLTTAALTTKNARSIVTEAILCESGIAGPSSDTRRPSPNNCARPPNCPTASELRRNPSMRANDTWCFPSRRVSRQAQVLRMWATPPQTITNASPQPKATMLARSLVGPARWIRSTNSRMPRMTPSMRRGIRALANFVLDTGHALATPFVVEIRTLGLHGGEGHTRLRPAPSQHDFLAYGFLNRAHKVLVVPGVH